MRYRFKGIVRTTGQTVEGHAHGNTPEEAYQALSDHGIVTESLREEPEALNLAGGAQQPLTSAIDSALDIAASQVPFDKVAERYKGKSVWVIDRDKIRTRVSQVVDQALRDAIGEGTVGGANAGDIRKQVADAIGGLFKDNRNLTSEVSNTSMKLEHQIKRIETMVQRQESLLAQLTIAISRIGTGGGGGGGGGWGPRRFAGQGAGGNEQNAVLLEIFKENLRLRGIEIDEPKPQEGGAPANGAAPHQPNHEPATASVAAQNPSTTDSSDSKGDQ